MCLFFLRLRKAFSTLGMLHLPWESSKVEWELFEGNLVVAGGFPLQLEQKSENVNYYYYSNYYYDFVTLRLLKLLVSY